jgi:YfiH family protein
VFHKDQQGIWRAQPLDALDWLVHGFGTRGSPVPANLATLHQIHSATVVQAAGRSGCLGEGDALITADPGAFVGVKTADCLPILLVDDRRRAVAAVHAGWRGTVQQIVRQTVEALRQHCSSRPEDLHAAIGPGIGVCCYEVGPEVAAEFGFSGRVHMDLADANRRQVIDSGIPPSRIYLAALCTMCGGEQFYSFRREKEQAGRMFSFVGLR